MASSSSSSSHHHHHQTAACSACGWTAKDQELCSYASGVKLFYGAGNRGVWMLGSNFILKERPFDDNPDLEVLSLKYLKENTTIPVPTVTKEWVDANGRSYFKLIERIEGETLEKAWPTLSAKEKAQIAKETATQLLKLRKFQSPRMESINGGPIYSGYLFGGNSRIPHGPFISDNSLWNDLAAQLDKLPEKALHAFRKRLPKCTPYTLTHGDLPGPNILVKDGHLAGIIDWETAGYFPVWWEWVATCIAYSKEDLEWKTMLREQMGEFPEEKEFWRDFYTLQSYPDLDQRGKALMEALLKE